MAEEGEMESIVPSALNTRSETGALVEVKFQKNPYQTQKYLEAEPKALGVTQIMLSLFFLSILGATLRDQHHYTAIIRAIISSASIIAGSVAIAAQNLHLPTLKACLGMQVVACVLSMICLFISSNEIVGPSFFRYCWIGYHNGTPQNMCDRLMALSDHVIGIEMLVQATQIALSATLAAFCCKVIQCCSPRSNVPVIVVNAPPGPQ
ncbi:uncharacterized protein LOC124625949 [Ictalurus punctatus]|uniref:Uncharacterized protein LOC124625949 n=1 Tax=Ictalurus punctatus TaxID=7998 RepID=A0A2D0RCK2_ICTPU|nr:uncharacterized protein LOC124625949 [Ictalurus punctatus]